MCLASISPNQLNAGALSIRVEDEATSPITPMLSEASVSYAPYREFVVGVLDGLGYRHEGTEFAGPDDPIKKNHLNFVRLPLVAPGATPVVVPPLGDVSCQADGGFARVSETQNGFVAQIIWNERQILAELAGSSGDAQDVEFNSYSRRAFDEYVETYVRVKLHNQSVEGGLSTIPVDVLWLFENAPQATRGPFGNGVISYLERALGEVSARYAARVSDEINACLRQIGR